MTQPERPPAGERPPTDEAEPKVFRRNDTPETRAMWNDIESVAKGPLETAEVAAIRQRWARVTPGPWGPMNDGPQPRGMWEPWQAHMEPRPGGLTIASPHNTEPICRVSGYLQPVTANAQAIASAPEDIAFLLGALQVSRALTEALRAAAPGASPAEDELALAKAEVLNHCSEREEGDARYLMHDEDGEPIVEAETLPEAVKQIIGCWNAVGVQLSAALRSGTIFNARHLASTGELVGFFRDEETAWGLKGDYENWSTERAAIELIRCLRAQIVAWESLENEGLAFRGPVAASPEPDKTCPCSAALVRNGETVTCHWTGSICADCYADIAVAQAVPCPDGAVAQADDGSSPGADEDQGA